MIRLGWSITRKQVEDKTPAVTCDHADFLGSNDVDAFEQALRQAHDQDHYDVRTWRTRITGVSQ